MQTIKIEVQFRLPYLLGLEEGEYQISPRQRILRITHPQVLYYTTCDGTQQLSCQDRSVVQMSFHRFKEMVAVNVAQQFIRIINELRNGRLCLV